MADFTLDTSGAVATGDAAQGTYWAYFWPDLSPFERGYTRKALEDLNEALRANPGNYLDGGEGVEYIGPTVGFSDLSPEALGVIRKDCKLAENNSYAWHTWLDRVGVEGGKNFWESRQKPHRWYAKTFPPLTVFLSDEGRVCLREAT